MPMFRGFPQYVTFAWCVTSALALPACGGGSKESRTADSESDDVGGESRSGGGTRHSLSSSSEVGALDPEKVTKAFEGAMPDLQNCVNDGAKRIEYLGGEIAFFVKIDSSGKIAQVHAERSTLGDRQTEECMFDALKKRNWPKPEGGEMGLARKSFAFDMPNDVREPTEWSDHDVVQVISDVSEKIAQCKQGVEGRFTVTVYVDTNGTALGAGVAAPEDSPDEASDCIADVLKSAKYPSPGSWPAKVTFAL